MYEIAKKMLFWLDAERAHGLAAWFLRRVAVLPFVQDYLAKRCIKIEPSLESVVAGMRFYNPIGLAAGFDKDAQMVRGLALLGFSHLELGSVTFNAQDGNEKPRLWRHKSESSLQNAMGFNNAGAKKVAQNLAQNYPFVLPLGVNIGKNKAVAQSDALKNYKDALAIFTKENLGDYFVFNVSSPNTPKLRDLANEKFVHDLFSMAKKMTDKPLFLKVSPDMEIPALLGVIRAAVESGASGIIATNTSVDYSLVEKPQKSGGISGAALSEKSRAVFEEIAREFFGKTILIAAGGIDSAQEAYARIKMGASLVQLYTALVYEGPSVVAKMSEGLAELLAADGYENISQAVGADIERLRMEKSRKDSKKMEIAKKTETAKKVESASVDSGADSTKTAKKPTDKKSPESAPKTAKKSAPKKSTKTTTTETQK